MHDANDGVRPRMKFEDRMLFPVDEGARLDKTTSFGLFVYRLDLTLHINNGNFFVYYKDYRTSNCIYRLEMYNVKSKLESGVLILPEKNTSSVLSF